MTERIYYWDGARSVWYTRNRWYIQINFQVGAYEYILLWLLVCIFFLLRIKFVLNCYLCVYYLRQGNTWTSFRSSTIKLFTNVDQPLASVRLFIWIISLRPTHRGSESPLPSCQPLFRISLNCYLAIQYLASFRGWRDEFRIRLSMGPLAHVKLHRF